MKPLSISALSACIYIYIYEDTISPVVGYFSICPVANHPQHKLLMPRLRRNVQGVKVSILCVVVPRPKNGNTQVSNRTGLDDVGEGQVERQGQKENNGPTDKFILH
jgi:hypothetical protein